MSLGAVSHIALWVISLLNLTLILVLYRQFGLSAMATAAGHDNDGVPVGDVAPPLLLGSPGSESALAEVSGGDGWSVVLFGTPHCEPCVDAMDQLNEAMSQFPAGIRVIAALNGVPEAVEELAGTRSYRFDVLLDPDGATMSTWQVKVTPFVLLLDPGRRVRAKALGSSADRLRTFVDTVHDRIGGDALVSAATAQRQ